MLARFTEEVLTEIEPLIHHQAVYISSDGQVITGQLVDICSTSSQVAIYDNTIGSTSRIQVTSRTVAAASLGDLYILTWPDSTLRGTISTACLIVRRP